VLAQPDGGTGLVLLAYRHDGRVELFADAGVEVDASGYDGLGEGLAGLHRTAFAPAVCEVTGAGLQVDLGIATPDGGRIEVRLRERLARGRDTIQMLAPVGGTFTSPAFFPFLWLPSLSFVPVRGTQVRVRIDGQDRRIARLPLPLGGRRCLMARYDPDVMVAQVNPTWVSEALRVRADGTDAADAADGADAADAADRTTPGAQRVDVGERDGRPAIRGVTVRRGPHACAVRLDPPLPDPRRLSDGSAVGGTVALEADGVSRLRGAYRVARQRRSAWPGHRPVRAVAGAAAAPPAGRAVPAPAVSPLADDLPVGGDARAHRPAAPAVPLAARRGRRRRGR